MKNILSPALLIIAALVFISLWGFYFAIRPIKITNPITPKNYGIQYESVSFRTKDGLLIRGWFIKNANSQAKTIILLHGYPADKGDILPSTLFLHKKYNLLYLDFRYLGESEGHYSTIGKNEVLDLLAAIQYLHSRNIQEVGVWGFSLGAAVALMTAPLTPAIKAIVADSSYARLDWMADDYYRIPLLRYPLAELTRLWGWIFLHFDIKNVSPAASVQQLHIPILIIHSKQDQVISFKHALLLEQSLRHNSRAKMMFVNSTMHGEHDENYEKMIMQFFADNL